MKNLKKHAPLALALPFLLLSSPLLHAQAQQEEEPLYHLITSRELSNIELLQATYEQERQVLRSQVRELREKLSKLIDYSQDLNVQLQEQRERNKGLETLFNQLECGQFRTTSSLILENDTLKLSQEKQKNKLTVAISVIVCENVLLAAYIYLRIRKKIPF